MPGKSKHRRSVCDEPSYPYSPVAGFYDASNTDTKLLEVNNRARPKSGSKLRGDADTTSRSSTPNPKRHSPERCHAKNPKWHQTCLDSSSPGFERRPKTADMWTNQKQRPAWKPSDESAVNRGRHSSCQVSSNSHWQSLEYSKPRRPLTATRPPVSMSSEHYLMHPRLSTGNKLYLWNIARAYDVANMKQLKQQQYLDLLRKQMFLGWHTKQEYQNYRGYITSTRKTPFSPAEDPPPRDKRPGSRTQSARSSTEERPKSSRSSRGSEANSTSKEDDESTKSDRKSDRKSGTRKTSKETENGESKTDKDKTDKSGKRKTSKETESDESKTDKAAEKQKPKSKSKDSKSTKPKKSDTKGNKDTASDPPGKKTKKPKNPPKKKTKNPDDKRDADRDNSRPKSRVAFLAIVTNEDGEKDDSTASYSEDFCDSDQEEGGPDSESKLVGSPSPKTEEDAGKDEQPEEEDEDEDEEELDGLGENSSDSSSESSESYHSDSWEQQSDGLNHSKEGSLRPKSRLGNRNGKQTDESARDQKEDDGETKENSPGTTSNGTSDPLDPESTDNKGTGPSTSAPTTSATDEDKAHPVPGSSKKDNQDAEMDRLNANISDTEDAEATTGDAADDGSTTAAAAAAAAAAADDEDEEEAAARHDSHTQLQRLLDDQDDGYDGYNEGSQESPPQLATIQMFAYLAGESSVCQNWKFILIHLGVSGTDIMSIEAEYYNDGPKDMVYQGFVKWQQLFGDSATLEKLCNALRTENLNYTADSLVEEFGEV